MPPRSTPGATSARGQGVSGVNAPLQSKTLNGKPVWKAKIPVTAQPLSKRPFPPGPPPQQLLEPNQSYGTSQVTLPIKRCLTSKSDGPSSLSGLNGERT